MSLQCFLNGSLAREFLKDKFEYSWEQFTQAISEILPAQMVIVCYHFSVLQNKPNLQRKQSYT